MTIQRCDKCHMEINFNSRIRVEFGFRYRVELCADCAKPIIELLKNYEILQDSWLERLYKETEEV